MQESVKLADPCLFVSLFLGLLSAAAAAAAVQYYLSDQAAGTITIRSSINESPFTTHLLLYIISDFSMSALPETTLQSCY